MTPAERRAAASLAGIYGLRLFGMFVILPVFALYATTLAGGASHTLVGVALGAYGLTQALLQIPFGWASDRWGRKPVIYSGLLIFAAGSFMAAAAQDIAWVIAGRCLQGAGAVSAAVLALTADLTRDAVRTRAMAAIGITIGATFAASLVIGPVLTGWIGVPGIFALTGLLALAAMAVVRFAVPMPERPADVRESPPAALRRVVRDPQLLRLSYGTFALHAALMALFTRLPFALRDMGLPSERHWVVYLPVLAVSVALMLPFLRQVDRAQRSKPLMNGAVIVLLAGIAGIALSLSSLATLYVALTVFFAAFNLLEAMLPSLVSKYAAAEARGAAIGINSSAQFLGAFAGAAVGGWLAEHAGDTAVFVFCLGLAAAWLVATATMAPPGRYARNYSMGET
ncbi:MAG: MFS transporter [Burkholderiales bacterium]|nr:MFS transporter [Burkholderiales bacterium]